MTRQAPTFSLDLRASSLLQHSKLSTIYQMASNPAKRKAFSSGSSGPTGASLRRAKTFDARTLAVQSTDAALSVTGELDVAAYASARAFEIQALENGIQRSKNSLTSRAFQKVPRPLRRRTASHNVKRVPRRLRTRAKREVYYTISYSLRVALYHA